MRIMTDSFEYIHITKFTDENVWLMMISEDTMKNMKYQYYVNLHAMSAFLAPNY